MSDNVPESVPEAAAAVKVEETEATPPLALAGDSSAPETPREPERATAASNAPPAAPAPAAAPAAASSAPGNTSLYVGELEPSVTEAMLYEIFSMIGPVASIRVCRDAVTRRSLGYAYVNYLNANDGERALEQLNYSLIKGKACRIMWSQRDPALRKTGAGNIFLKNLDETIDNKALHDTFAAFGNILSCKVALDELGVSKGYGFVHFDTAEAASAAIDAVNGMLLNDKVVFVGHHVPKRERQAKVEEIRSRFTNLYVKGVAPDVTSAELEELFAQYGSITSALVQMDEAGKSKGFGFVNFDQHEDAAAALDGQNEKDFRGSQLIVTRAQKKGEREEELRKSYEQQKYEKTLKYQGVNLYVKNLDDDMEEDKLTAEFAAYGAITSCKIMRDDKGVSKGFGFVCFSSPDEATRAVTELNGKMLGTKPLYVSLAQRKDVRKQQLEAQVAQRNQIRSQQIAASGIPQMQGFMPPGQPLYYPAGYPQQAARAGMMYPPQPNMMGARPRYAPPGQMPGMPMPAYPQQQGYPGGYPRAPLPPAATGRYPSGLPPPAGLPQPNGMQPPATSQLPSRGGLPAPINGVGPQRAPSGVPAGGIPRVPPVPAGAQAGYKLNANTRNAPDNQPQRAGPAITAAALANASAGEQKQILGEAIYPRIHESEPNLAGKITGMLLEMDNAELLHLLEDDEALSAKVSEAISVLEAYQTSSRSTGEVGAET